MRKPFDSEFPLTQDFNDACCRADYAKFGLQGHNGQDYGLPTGTKVVAPHNGKVIEATLDPQGYGLYIKIENSIEGSVLAHLKEFRVGVDDVISEGQLIAYSDNSGNSTGPHLHWGYYRFPRNRQNGFAGFIDQTQYLNANIPDAILDQLKKENDDLKAQVADEIKKKNETYQELVETKQSRDGLQAQVDLLKNDLIQIGNQLGTTGDFDVIAKKIGELISQEDLNVKIAQITKERDIIKQQYDDIEKQLQPALKENNLFKTDLYETQDNLRIANERIESMKININFRVLISFLGFYICRKNKL